MNMRKLTGKAAILAAAFALGAATTAEAARYWTGNTSSKWSESKNWNGNSGRRYFFNNQLTGEKRDYAYLAGDVTESIGVCFGNVPSSGWWRFQGQGQYSYNNSAGSAYDNGLICIGYSGQSSSARFHAITITTKNLTVGGDSSASVNYLQGDMTGYLVLDELNNAATAYYGPISITATSTCDFYRGDLYATNATITSSGNMTLYTFNAEKTGGDWTLNGDLIIGAKAGASATFTQNSGTVTVKDNKWTKSTSGNGTLNLNGGTFVTQHIEDEVAGGSLTVNINGGTLKANNVHSKGWITHGNGAGLNVNVGADGCTIDTDGLDLPIHVAVNAVENTAGSFTVTGGGSATFSAMGNLAGAFTVGDNTTLHWFDQDNTVANYTISALNLGAGSTLCLDADATGCDTITTTVTNIAATATICLNFLENVLAGTQYVLFEAASRRV